MNEIKFWDSSITVYRDDVGVRLQFGLDDETSVFIYESDLQKILKDISEVSHLLIEQ